MAEVLFLFNFEAEMPKIWQVPVLARGVMQLFWLQNESIGVSECLLLLSTTYEAKNKYTQ